MEASRGRWVSPCGCAHAAAVVTGGSAHAHEVVAEQHSRPSDGRRGEGPERWEGEVAEPHAWPDGQSPRAACSRQEWRLSGGSLMGGAPAEQGPCQKELLPSKSRIGEEASRGRGCVGGD